MIRSRPAAVALTLAGSCLVAVAWLGWRAWQAHDHLARAARAMPVLQRELETGDVRAATGTLAGIRRDAAAARADTRDPLWRLGGYLPGAGPQLTAVAQIAAAVDELARSGLPPLLDAAGGVEPAMFAPKNGRIDLVPLERAAPRVAAARVAIDAARDRVAGISPRGLLPPVAAAVAELRARLDRAAGTVATVDRAVRLLPPMLGASGPRTYLLMFQNLGEVRATGGMFGAYAVVRVADGVPRILEQHTAGAKFDRPVVTLDPPMNALYTDRPAVYPADVNFTPDFPTAAALASEMYRRRSGRPVDGVLATDPVALSYVLAGTGPVRLPGGVRLTADNAVPLLLSDVYRRFASQAGQDGFFAAAARGTFDALVRRIRTPDSVLSGLNRAAGERRLLLWSAHAQEERQLDGTVLAGRLPTVDGARPVVGVFLNDGTGAKLDYYLRLSADLTAGVCRDDGRRYLLLRLTLRSVAPASGLPWGALGWRIGPDLYTAHTNVMVFTPTGGGVMDAALDGVPVSLGSGTERGRAVGVVPVSLPPGATRTLQFSLLTGVVPWNTRPLPVQLRTTPTVTPWDVRVDSLPPCQAR